MVSSDKKVGRNDPCPCGSGKKFKRCCLNSQGATEIPSGLQCDPQEGEITLPLYEQAQGAFREYDPVVEPDPEQWLALDEQERIDLVMEYHRRARIRVPRAKAHAIFHVIVESQIADAELPVRRIAQRLMSEGLDRHEAIHAIGSVLAAQMHDLVSEARSGSHGVEENSKRDPNEAYFAELEALTAQEWRRSG
ncbi:SEC-C metal-binding domain-containing protein [Bradyrhizobium sp. CB1015]|uniref:SEC-C metal-binding domain-containing protein n=1 Tax=Bradyrhizobium sp. CB1015 TaxID=2976822 RepID=UPI0021AA4A75|nr:SEC-C metal-binding domain-containing protein [Bradyrhizobium sp. CB1015]UWU91654.1 SEC-C metal-binding domain-containing protein [Bradyrhizobium sp. CB1015]